jgi:hypothetical protein
MPDGCLVGDNRHVSIFVILGADRAYTPPVDLCQSTCGDRIAGGAVLLTLVVGQLPGSLEKVTEIELL